MEQRIQCWVTDNKAPDFQANIPMEKLNLSPYVNRWQNFKIKTMRRENRDIREEWPVLSQERQSLSCRDSTWAKPGGKEGSVIHRKSQGERTAERGQAPNKGCAVGSNWVSWPPSFSNINSHLCLLYGTTWFFWSTSKINIFMLWCF